MLERVVFLLDRLDCPAEAYLVGGFLALELPWIAVGEPVFRHFDLLTVLDLLLEKPMLVADAITIGRDIDARHALHEAGGEPAEAAIAQRRIGLERFDQIEVDIEALERLRDGFDEAEIAHRIAQEAADEEFEREVIDPLGAPCVGIARRIHPVIDDPVAHRMDGGGEPIMVARHERVLAHRVSELFQDFGPQGRWVGAPRRRLRRIRVNLRDSLNHGPSTGLCANVPNAKFLWLLHPAY